MTQSGLKLSLPLSNWDLPKYVQCDDGGVIYRERVVNKQRNLSGKEWVVLVPFSANSYKTRHGSVQFVQSAARLQMTTRPTELVSAQPP